MMRRAMPLVQWPHDLCCHLASHRVMDGTQITPYIGVAEGANYHRRLDV